jgi:hypothetical protein
MKTKRVKDVYIVDLNCFAKIHKNERVSDLSIVTD